jgi:hypothetical protein
MKIDSSCDGKISWEEFCTFMQLNFSEKEDAIKRQKEVAFNTPARTENNPHRHNINKVACTGDNQFMVMAAVREKWYEKKYCLVFIFFIIRMVKHHFGDQMVNLKMFEKILYVNFI